MINTYENVKIVHIDCPLQKLIERDTKGLYKRAFLPKGHPDRVPNLTGINDDYEAPVQPDLYINTDENNLEKCVRTFSSFIVNNHFETQHKYHNTVTISA